MGKEKSEAGENIKVAVRVRPLFQKEIDRGDKECVECDLASNQVIVRGETGNPYTWTFDYVFNKTFAQKDIFIQVIHPMIESVMEGFNATIFAYGQSGSGKTHTMTGVLNDKVLEGIIPRSFHYIFGRIKEAPAGQSWRLFCSFLELYNGKCRDLMVNDIVSLQIREQADKNFFVQDLTMPEVRMEKELFAMMEEGTARRCVGVTDLNAHSSRSHSVFTVYLEKTEVGEDGDTRTVTSKLNLVDLAGSERQSKTNATGDRLKEGANINLSLSALGTVIDSIVKGKPHIPFRSSPLTMLLKDSLGGGSKTVMFANVRPSDQDLSETVSTLRFADRAKQIKNKPKVQMDPKDARIAELMDEITHLKVKLKKYEGGASSLGDGFDGELSGRVAQLELELEESRSAADLLATEMDQRKAAQARQLAEAQAQVAAAREQLSVAQQERSLGEQQLAEEQSQRRELQRLLLEFMKDVAPEAVVVAGDAGRTGDDAPDVDVAAASRALDAARERLRPAGGRAGALASSMELPSALIEQRRKFEEQDHDREVRHKAEVEQLVSLNDQSQGALNQAMAQLTKMKEQTEKESQRRAEQHQKQLQSLQQRHRADLQGLLARCQALPEDVRLQLSADIAELQAQPLPAVAGAADAGAGSPSPGHPPRDRPHPIADVTPSPAVSAAQARMQQQRERLEAGQLRDAEEVKAALQGVLKEGEVLVTQLHAGESDRRRLQRVCDDLMHEAEQHSAAQHQWEAEKKELQRELEQARMQVLAEVQRVSGQNKEQIALVKKVEEVQRQAQARDNERHALEEELSALKAQLRSGGGDAAELRQAFTEKERRHARELQRLMALLQEKGVTLENNRKVLKTLHDLLDKKNKTQQELEEQVSALQTALRDMQEEVRVQFHVQVEKLTLQNNRRIEELVQAHRQQLRKEQKEREKMTKRMQKERGKTEKAKERYDQQLVVARELEEQVEHLKEGQLRTQLGDFDIPVRNLPPRRSEPTNRQQELLAAKSHVLEVERDREDVAMHHRVKNGHRRQAELLAQAGKDKELLDPPKWFGGDRSPSPW